ncbi:MAG TPA: PilZ domain-containing protein [Candidatus Dormibacteraeota bacterium]|nr:PilZ domain-containing protein [Candidatus Dormibacteraeota bacterium]
MPPLVSSTSSEGRRYERRHAPRYFFNADLKLEWGSTTLRGRLADISVNGMFIEMSDPLWLGAGFAGCLELEQPVRLECSVRRVEPGRGMGVTFVIPEPESKARVLSLLGSLADKSIGSSAGPQSIPQR